jgi:ADP-ribosyl-[dinitrogen reductase] hydrolase
MRICAMLGFDTLRYSTQGKSANLAYWIQDAGYQMQDSGYICRLHLESCILNMVIHFGLSHGFSDTTPSHEGELKMQQLERYRGALLGLAAGDAVGTTLEFMPPGSFDPIEDMVGGGPFRLAAGQWTDDTSMALCLAESLIDQNGFEPIDQLKRYCRWYRQGHLSSTGRCFDIGNTTRAALHRFEQTNKPDSGSTDAYSAGNGSIMRLAPVPLFYAQNPQEAVEKSGESSKTTHGTTAAVDACRYLGGLLVGAVNGIPKAELLADGYSPVPGYWSKNPLMPEINEIAFGSFKHRQPPEIQGTGYVVKSLESALWAFYRSDSFREGCLLAVNLGDDADTTGAVYGQLAGAFYGEMGIPASWRNKLAHRQLIESYADGLFAGSRSLVSSSTPAR